MIDRATVDKIMDAVRIEEVIGDFVSLRKRGANYLGLCPFHQDKNPSMSVSSTKGIFKCFACGKAGNAVTFLMEHEHLTYWEALRYLAKKYHIEIVEKEETAEEIAHRMRYESLLVVTEYAQKYFADILWNTEVGRAIGLSYFHERKFTDETIRKFGLGYAASRPLTLCGKALKEGYKKEYLVDAGLCLEREGSGELYDRFFDRVIFPIHSISGRVIAFGGRTLKTDKSVAKYVNSPQSEIYDKSRSLYGIFQAKNSIAKSDKCILVEGYADVISMHQAGVTNVVASSGTSLTVEQIRLIKRFTDKVTIIYDGDAAGIKAALRGIDLVLEEGLSVKVVLLPPEDDPDSFAKAHSLIEIQEYIEENEKDFISFKSDLLLQESERDPVRRAQVIRDIVQSVAMVPDPILRNIYVDLVSEKFDQKSDSVLATIAEIRRKKKALERSRRRFENPSQPWQGGVQQPQEPVPEELVPEDLPGEEEPVRRQPSGYVLRDAFLAVPERELTYYLVKFGEYPLHFEEDMVYGSEPHSEITVSQYIRNSLADDDLVFVNDLYRTIFERYYNFAATLPQEDCALRQQRMIRYLTTGEDQVLNQAVFDLILEEHPLTVKSYEESITPEDQALGRTVPKSVLLYKLRITDQQCAALSREITQAQRGGQEETLRELVRKLQLLNTVKNRLSKELNRL
ncbi:MAG: DNA primase [Bacteroidales bacterium]|nr:DNA primase [Bacteroidales bacterium]